jgi:hypothetical protein
LHPTDYSLISHTGQKASSPEYPNRRWLSTKITIFRRFLEAGPITNVMPTLLHTRELLYNPRVPFLPRVLDKWVLAALSTVAVCSFASAQQVPPASGARILLLPRKMVTGERATLAVLDVNGKLTPGVNVVFSNGDKVTTDATGRALFVVPLNAGNIFGSIEGRTGRVSSTIVSPADAPSAVLVVSSVPRAASLTDRLEILGNGFCGEADSNRVTIGGIPALVLASSPSYLAVLPPLELDPGPVRVQVKCGQKSSEEFSVVFVSLELDAKSSTLAPGEHRTLIVHITGSTTKINLEARNLAPEVAELKGGTTVRVLSTGGKENTATFELAGRQRGNFVISVRLVAPQSPPHL